MKRSIFLLALLVNIFYIQSQESREMSLQMVLEMAANKSLEAYKAQNRYLASYWEYRTFQASQLPSVSLNLTPVDFRRAMTKRYDFEQNIDVFREQKTMDNYGRIAVSQVIPGTGGQIYIDSDLSRLVNFDNSRITTFSATWLRIGVLQPLFGFNQLKWEKKISPLKYETAKKEYLKNLQQTKLTAVYLYFELLSAYVKKEIAESNYATADTLFRIGNLKFDLLSVNREELLNLELSKFNAEIEITKAEQEIEKANFNLNSFLGIENNQKINPVLPDIKNIEGLLPNDAIELAKKNNPEILLLEQKKLEADKMADKAIKESRFSANLTASFGLNQYAEEFKQAYRDPLDQQIVILGLQIPILDWGERKGKKEMARKNQEIVSIENRQALNDFEQSLVLKVMEFNLQPKLVESASKANQIAELSFELTKKRFMLGKADLLQMENSIKARQSAREKYVNSLFVYWKYYYELQLLTLFDLETQMALDEDFEKIQEK